MKKCICLILSLSFMFGLCACGATPASDSTTEPVQQTVNLPKKLLVSQVTGIPVATNDMSKAELRQMVVDFFELQMSFQWLTNLDITDYDLTNLKSKLDKNVTTDAVYGGIPYQSLGTGNLYRWLEYYDETTGIVDLATAAAENGGYGEGAAIFDQEYDADGKLTYKKYRVLQAMFNQCSSSSVWAWGRVVNSVRFGWSWDNSAYRGLIPVGCFDYGYDHEGKHYGITEIDTFRKSENHPKTYTTSDAIDTITNNDGYYAIYECYAQCKPGDVLIRNGHVMMVKEVATKYTKSGKLDFTNSKIIALEQIEAWASSGTKVDGRPYYGQGRTIASYTFDELKNEGYLPFTCAEFLDENDPQDKKHLDYYRTYADKIPGPKDCYQTFDAPADAYGAEVEKAYALCTATGESITAADFEAMTVGANYPISDVFVTVTDPSGKELVKNVHRTDTLYAREVAMSAGVATWELDESGNRLPISTGVAALADGQNTVTVKVQISTGEQLTAFTGILTK